MEWIKNYDLFLFDFDGLLVNTEEVHYKAYQKMMKERGVPLTWSFERYCQAAHYKSTALKEQIYQEFPAIHRIEPDWAPLYAEKQQAVLDLINEGQAHLMPGVKELLETLQKNNLKRVVVTHSPAKMIHLVRSQNSLLDTIPFWITREHYTHAKPDPECYQKAIEKYSTPTDRIIGFEDTPRGLQALMGTRSQAVLISQILYPEIPAFKTQGAWHFKSLTDIIAQ